MQAMIRRIGSRPRCELQPDSAMLPKLEKAKAEVCFVRRWRRLCARSTYPRRNSRSRSRKGCYTSPDLRHPLASLAPAVFPAQSPR